AGETLVGAFLPQLAQSEVLPTADYDARFHVWDSQSTGIAMVPPICPREHFTNRGDMWSLLSRQYRSAFHMDDGHLSLFDAKSATGVHWVHAADLLSDAARAFPWRDLLHWWMQARGGQLVAGSVLGQGGKGVFVLGMSEDSRQALINLGTAGGLSLLADGWMVRAPASGSFASPLYVPAGSNAQPFELKGAVLARDTVAGNTHLTPADNRLLQRIASFATTTQLPHADKATEEAIEEIVTILPAFQLDPAGASAAQ